MSVVFVNNLVHILFGHNCNDKLRTIFLHCSIVGLGNPILQINHKFSIGHSASSRTLKFNPLKYRKQALLSLQNG